MYVCMYVCMYVYIYSLQVVRDSASRLLEKEILDIEHSIRKLQLEMARQTAEILRLEQVGG